MIGLEYFKNPINGNVPTPLPPTSIRLDTSSVDLSQEGWLESICKDAGIDEVAPYLIQPRADREVYELFTDMADIRQRSQVTAEIVYSTDNFYNIFEIKHHFGSMPANVFAHAVMDETERKEMQARARKFTLLDVPNLVAVYKQLPELLNHTRAIISLRSIGKRIYDGYEDYEMFPIITKNVKTGKVRLDTFEGIHYKDLKHISFPYSLNGE